MDARWPARACCTISHDAPQPSPGGQARLGQDGAGLDEPTDVSGVAIRADVHARTVPLWCGDHRPEPLG